jgi:hypothetical protein
VIILRRINKNQENEVGGAWGTYGREKMCVQGFCGKRLHLGDLGIDGKVILKYLKGIC